MKTTVNEMINASLATCEATIADSTATDAQLGYATRLKKRCEDALIMLREYCDENDAWCYVQSGESEVAIRTACAQLADQLDASISYRPTQIRAMLRAKGVISAALVVRKMECEISVFHKYIGTKDRVKHYGAGVFQNTLAVAAYLRNI